MLHPVYFFGPFKNVFGFADPCRFAPLDMQPDNVLRAVTRHSLSCDARKEAVALLAERGAR